MSEITESSDLAPKSEEYLRKIIALAKEEYIPLVFMISPYQGIVESEQMIFNRCGEIAEEEGIPFLDFNRMYDELGLNPETDVYKRQVSEMWVRSCIQPEAAMTSARWTSAFTCEKRFMRF